MPFLGPKWSICPIFGPICPEQKIFGKNHYYYFGKNHYLPIGPFHCVRFKKILAADPIMRMYHFWTQNGPFAPNQFFFFFENYWYYSHLHINPFHWAKFLKILPRSYEDVQFLSPEWPISPNENFFRKPVYEPCLFLSFMPAAMPKIKVRNLKYWNLIGRETFLDKTWEPDFSQACTFCRILMN